MAKTLKEKTWSEIKALVSTKAPMDYEIKKDRFKVFVVVGETKFFINLYEPSSRKIKRVSATNDADYNDFVNNFKPNIDNNPPKIPNTVDLMGIDNEGGKLAINPTSRPIIKGIPLSTTFCGVGDDLTNHVMGAGNILSITTEVGVVKKFVDVEFDPIFGKVFIQEGYARWNNAGMGDAISISIFAKASPLQTLTNLNLELDNSIATAPKIKFASGGPGTGTHGFAGVPVLTPANEGPSVWGTKRGWWDYSIDNGLVPNNDQMGEYDMYTTSVELGRFVNKIPILGTSDSYNMVRSSDYAEIPANYFIRFYTHNNSNTVWNAFAFLTLFRETSVDGNPI